MRKIKLQLQLSIDGFIAGPNSEMDWLMYPWTEDINCYVQGLIDSTDTIILGRKLAEGFIPYWTSVANDPENQEYSSGKQLVEMPKIVFSNTLKTNLWHNTTLNNGEIVDEITKLKSQKGKDIYSCGGSNFVSNLLKHNLVDELFLFVNPVVLGKGLGIFEEVQSRQNYLLKEVRSFECGIFVQHFVKV